ncbi:hypothetical protein NQ152_14335 [Microbacterium sp. zg.B48]|uniref:endonuclease domain-containing protein n=1 Tax=Microbacterium sp. zg.B48 TaxID=2969408 RepID=UPI00214B8A22|nr:hypothetical protein [Microbacterium sp. zg.B48]MCR2764687.1 hypothetical protein [Microbacterium sp. zg.B48]
MREPTLPASLGAHFSVAAAIRAGVPASRLRRTDLHRPFHGVRARPDPGDDEFDRFGRPLGPAERDHLRLAREYAEWMADGHFFSHLTAAVIWGLPVPRSLVERPEVDVAVFPPLRLPRSRGVRGHETTPRLTTIRRDARTGLLVASPASTWAMLGATFRDPYDLVAAGDAAIRDWRVPSPLATLAELEAAVRSGRRVGIPALRAALPQLRTRSASRPETVARLTLVSALLPEPELNVDVLEAGVRLACVDLAYPDLKIGIEYEGEHHLLDPEQWAHDILRYERLAAAGWQVIRVTKAELFAHPSTFIARVRAAIAQRS